MALGERLSSAAKILFEGTALERAFKPLDTEGKVSIQGYPDRQSDFDLDNGAVYLGALPERSRLKKIVDAFDYRDADSAYSETGVLAVLQQAALRRKKGQKLKIVLVSALREECNDGEAPVLTFEGQKKRITQLCGRHLKLLPENLDFINMADEHPDLFQSLQEAETVETAFSKTPEDEDWGSYRIAYDLYQAVKADSNFAQVFKGLMPDGLPDEEEEGGFSFLAAYSLFETAIHLADVIRGRPCQIGVGRQSEYNKVVIELMKGQKGRWKDLTELHPLFEKVSPLTFAGVNVAKSPNPVTSNIRRTRARIRLVAGFGGAATLVGFGALLGREIEQRHLDNLDAIYLTKMAEIVDDQSCNGEDAWMRTLDKEDKKDKLKSKLDEVRKILEVRYGITYSNRDWKEDGISSFLDFLSVDTQGYGYNGLCDFLVKSDAYAIDMTDRYVTTRKTNFGSKGYEVTRPYAYLGDLDFNIPDTPISVCTGDLPPGFSSEYLGQFSPFNHSRTPIDLYEVRKLGRSFIATRNEMDCYTTEKMPEIAEDYAFTLRRWAALPYRHHQTYAYQRFNDDIPSEIDEENLIHPYPPFVDPMGQFAYDLALYPHRSNVGFTEYHLFARRKGEERFSKEAALEFLDIMNELEMPWYYDSGNYPKFVQTKP